MIRNVSAMLLTATLLLTSPALAAPQEGNASFSVFGGGFMFDKAEHLDDGPVIGLRLGYDLHRNIGLEGSFGFADTRSNMSTAKPQAYAYTYRADLLYYLLPESPFVPFLTVGGGVMNINGSELWGNRTSLLLEYGVGAKYFLADNLALRADGRNLYSFDNNRHSDFEITGGISYYFNKGQTTPVNIVTAVAPPAEKVIHATPLPVKPTPPAPKAEDAALRKPEPAPVDSKIAPEKTPAVAETSSQGAKTAPAIAVAAPPAAAIKAAPLTLDETAAPAQAACSSITRITKVITSRNGFEIVADSTLDIPRALTLSNPTRLSLDIACAANGSGSKVLKLNHSGVSAVRIGSYSDKIRVVFDFDKAPVPPYRVEKTGKGLKVYLDSSAKR